MFYPGFLWLQISKLQSFQLVLSSWILYNLKWKWNWLLDEIKVMEKKKHSYNNAAISTVFDFV